MNKLEIYAKFAQNLEIRIAELEAENKALRSDLFNLCGDLSEHEDAI